MMALISFRLGLFLLVSLPRLVSAFAPLPTRTSPPVAPRPQLEVRQDSSSSDITILFPTTTASFTPPPPEPTEAPTPSLSISTEPHQDLFTKSLEVAPKPIPLAATMGLIMPNPYDKAFVEIEYQLGFVEVVPRPAPTLGGWLRVVSPVLLFPDRTVNVLPESGTADPGADIAIPPGSGGLCGHVLHLAALDWANFDRAVAENFPKSYPYIFHRPGWYMFVLNQTWLQPTVTNSTCALPLVSQQSFFATHVVSISPLPTGGAMPRPPTSVYTLWAGISTDLPGALPAEPHTVGRGEKLGIGLGVTGAILAFIACIGGLMYVRSKKKAKRETIAFNRLKPHDQAQFLADNPDHFLNPYRRAGRTGVDGWGRPITGWRGWGRWGQGSGVNGWGGSGGAANQGWGGIQGVGQGGMGYGQQSQGLGGIDQMRQVYNVPPQAIGGPGPIGMAGQQQPLMVWPTEAQQGGYGYR